MDWNVLKDRKIIDLFIGDKEISSPLDLEENIMPYMKGFQICQLANKLGLEINYNEQPMSRWQYMEKTIDFCVLNNKINDFFKELLLKERFEYLVDINNRSKNPQELYYEIINNLFIKINDYLSFKDYYIKYNLEKNIYRLEKINTINNFESNTEEYMNTISRFCKQIKKEGLSTRYGLITNIKEESGKQGANGRILFGIMNKHEVAIKILYQKEKSKGKRFFEEFILMY